jgi:hypothetical protein
MIPLIIDFGCAKKIPKDVMERIKMLHKEEKYLQIIIELVKLANTKDTNIEYENDHYKWMFNEDKKQQKVWKKYLKYFVKDGKTSWTHFNNLQIKMIMEKMNTKMNENVEMMQEYLDEMKENNMIFCGFPSNDELLHNVPQEEGDTNL